MHLSAREVDMILSWRVTTVKGRREGCGKGDSGLRLTGMEGRKNKVDMNKGLSFRIIFFPLF